MRGVAVGLLAMLVLAGCAAEAPAAAVGTSSSAPLDPAAAFGELVVEVMNAELQPIEGAQVLLQPLDRSLVTGPDGRAVFAELEPGEYTVAAAKPGFKAVETRGRIAAVQAGASTTAKLTLEPVAVVDPNSSYHLSTPFKGFISCSFSGQGTATSACGRGVGSGGTTVRDPNEKSIHELVVTSQQAASMVMEAKWQPSVGVAPSELHLSANRESKCTPGCVVDSQLFFAAGKSPLYASNKPENPIGTWLSKDPAKFPFTVFVGMRAYCVSPCVASLAFQQSYEGWATIFYGEPAPGLFTAYPTEAR